MPPNESYKPTGFSGKRFEFIILLTGGYILTI